MGEVIFFDNAKDSVTNFFEQEFPTFPVLMISHFLNRFNDFLNYTEEGVNIRPKIVFTDNIESVLRSIPKSYAFPVFEDNEATMFNKRIKSLLAISNSKWPIYIDIKEKITYGLILSFTSIKDKDFIRALEENTSLKDKPVKVNCIVMRPLNFYSMSLHSISGNDLVVNFSLDKTKNNEFSTEIKEFVDATFSKLRTTQRKLQDMKNMYFNIFSNVMSDVHGAICVIVDKDYKDTGLFEDGIWLKEPVNFSHLFTQSKSYSEEKLQAFATLFFNMLNFDGITIVDNLGRLRAFNVFVEPNNKRVGYIVGGARKRAAYYILSTKKKGIVGVYFQSHEGEVFFQQCVHREVKPKKPVQKKLEDKKPDTTKDKSTNETEIKIIELPIFDDTVGNTKPVSSDKTKPPQTDVLNEDETSITNPLYNSTDDKSTVIDDTLATAKSKEDHKKDA